MRVALVHDWLTGFAGAERVVLELHRMFPQAPIYTSVYNPKAAPQFATAEVRTSFIQKLPLARRKHQFFPLLRRRAFEGFDFSGFDLVISSSGAEAKGIRTAKPTLHVNYCHSPTHYYWTHYKEYLDHPGFGALDPLARAALRSTIKRSRKWDYAAAQRPDYMLANSHVTQQRIKQFYGRDAEVIFPPVDVAKFEPHGSAKRRSFIVIGRQVPYKRIDLAVAACTKLNLPLTVIGDGPDHTKLRRMAGPTVTFRGTVSELEKIKLLQSHAAFIFPNEDDFGIVAVEAMAAGCPVIALRAGGALDSVKSGVSGIFFEKQTVDSLSHALESFQRDKFESAKVIAHARQFSAGQFRAHLQTFINKVT